MTSLSTISPTQPLMGMYLPGKEENKYSKARSFHQMLDICHDHFKQETKNLPPAEQRMFLETLTKDLNKIKMQIDDFPINENTCLQGDSIAALYQIESVIGGAFQEIARLDSQANQIDEQFSSLQKEISSTTLDFTTLTVSSVSGAIVGNQMVKHVQPVTDQQVNQQLNKVEHAHQSWKAAVTATKEATKIKQDAFQDFKRHPSPESAQIRRTTLFAWMKTESTTAPAKKIYEEHKVKLTELITQQAFVNLVKKAGTYAGGAVGGVLGTIFTAESAY